MPTSRARAMPASYVRPTRVAAPATWPMPIGHVRTRQRSTEAQSNAPQHPPHAAGDRGRPDRPARGHLRRSSAHPAPGAGHPPRTLTREAANNLSAGMAPIPINIADWVGRTPMVQLTRLLPDSPAALFAKLEMFNPGGSVKDRIGVAMIEAAEAEGRIEPGRTTIVEATSGNTGIALAFVCAAKGYDLILTLPQGMSREREGLLRLYGAQVRVTESLGGMNEAVAAAQALARDPDVWLPDQFSNPANPEAHYRATGPEIWAAMEQRVDCFVAGVGTGGTLTGAGRFLKERNPDCRIVAVEPAASPVLSGGRAGPHKIQGIGAGFVPPVLDRALVDETIPVDDEDALETARLVARREGVLAGISCGAALYGALQVAQREESRGARIAVVLP